MNIKQVLKLLKDEYIQHHQIDLSLPITGVCDNSKDVQKQYLFVAIEGFLTDGHTFIEEAITKGAHVIIGEKSIPATTYPYIQVKNSRKVLGMIAATFYKQNSKAKTIIGITGTNGKTTTSYMLKHIFESFGKSCAIIGTIGNIINGKILNSTNTTPNSLTLHQLLAESNDYIVIMEVSSHGLSQYRIEGITFDYCLFTNLDHEHLDYHSTIEDYFNTKVKLFDYLKPDGLAIINADDCWGEKIKELLCTKKLNVYSYGHSEKNDWIINQLNLIDSTFSLSANGIDYQFHCPLPGKHNMYNLIMALFTASLCGIPIHLSQNLMSEFKGVKGRFEIYKFQNKATIIIDYAHTKEAIENCLQTARQFGAKRIIHIFGFRGNRDPSKRKDMLVATRYLSDQYILTMDDLNTVPKQEMIQTLEDLQQKFGNEKGHIISDRTRAIQTAILQSQPQDWIIITGKGHENYQQEFFINANNDRETVLQIINHGIQNHEGKNYKDATENKIG